MLFRQKIKDIKSIKLKLAIMLNSIAVITLLLVGVSVFIFLILKKTSVDQKNLIKLTNIMADNISASVTFDDQESAINTLAALKSDPNIKGALILSSDHREFASYFNKDFSEQEVRNIIFELVKNNNIKTKQQTSYMDLNDILVSKPILIHQEHIATLIINYSTKQIYATILEVMSILLIVFLVSVLVTFYISSKLQSVFTKPIYTLIENIEHVINTSKYDKKITQHRNDEFQKLYNGFNTLLDTIDNKTNELHYLASIDPMTKLYNRRYLTDISQHIIERAKRDKTKLVVVMLDIDFFKKINDHYGHKVGDEVIVTIATILQSIVRLSDIVCRFGGEEFLLLLPETGVDGGMNISEKIRKAIESSYIETDENIKIKFTISCGVSEVDLTKDKNIEPAIQRADKALYVAKDNGRNRVEFL